MRSKAGSAILRPVGVAVAILALCGAATVAEARGGFFDFFSQGFGGDDERPLPPPDYVPSNAPPLTVRAHPHKHRVSGSVGGSERYDVAALKGITIYTDRTLMRGDVVMTASGIKVFNGSSSWPHTESDFTAVADTTRVPESLRKELTAINNASRPQLGRW